MSAEKRANDVSLSSSADLLTDSGAPLSESAAASGDRARTTAAAAAAAATAPKNGATAEAPVDATAHSEAATSEMSSSGEFSANDLAVEGGAHGAIADDWEPAFPPSDAESAAAAAAAAAAEVAVATAAAAASSVDVGTTLLDASKAMNDSQNESENMDESVLDEWDKVETDTSDDADLLSKNDNNIDANALVGVMGASDGVTMDSAATPGSTNARGSGGVALSTDAAVADTADTAAAAAAAADATRATAAAVADEFTTADVTTQTQTIVVPDNVKIEPRAPSKVGVEKFNKLLEMYCARGHMRSAEELLAQMQSSGVKPDVRTFNALIGGYRQKLFMRDAESALHAMRAARVPPDARTYHLMLCGYCSKGYMREAEDMVQRMEREHFALDSEAYNALVRGYCAKKDLRAAEAALERMRRAAAVARGGGSGAPSGGGGGGVGGASPLMRSVEAEIGPDQSTYHLLLEAYCEAGAMLEAEDVVQRMCDGSIELQAKTFNILLKGYCDNGDVQSARVLVDKRMRALKVTPNERTFNLLLKGYVKNHRSLNEAEEVLTLMREREIPPQGVAYNTLISAFCRILQLERALRLYADMRAANVPTCNFTYAPLLGAAVKLRRFELALELFEQCPPKYHTNPFVRSWASIAWHRMEASTRATKFAHLEAVFGAPDPAKASRLQAAERGNALGDSSADTDSSGGGGGGGGKNGGGGDGFGVSRGTTAFADGAFESQSDDEEDSGEGVKTKMSVKVPRSRPVNEFTSWGDIVRDGTRAARYGGGGDNAANANANVNAASGTTIGNTAKATMNVATDVAATNAATRAVGDNIGTSAGAALSPTRAATAAAPASSTQAAATTAATATTTTRDASLALAVPTLRVDNVADEVEGVDILNAFGEFGHIRAIVLNDGFALVEYDEKRSAQQGYRAAQATPIKLGGRHVKVTLHTPSEGSSVSAAALAAAAAAASASGAAAAASAEAMAAAQGKSGGVSRFNDTTTASDDTSTEDDGEAGEDGDDGGVDSSSEFEGGDDGAQPSAASAMALANAVSRNVIAQAAESGGTGAVSARKIRAVRATERDVPEVHVQAHLDQIKHAWSRCLINPLVSFFLPAKKFKHLHPVNAWRVACRKVKCSGEKDKSCFFLHRNSLSESSARAASARLTRSWVEVHAEALAKKLAGARPGQKIGNGGCTVRELHAILVEMGLDVALGDDASSGSAAVSPSAAAAASGKASAAATLSATEKGKAAARKKLAADAATDDDGFTLSPAQAKRKAAKDNKAVAAAAAAAAATSDVVASAKPNGVLPAAAVLANGARKTQSIKGTTLAASNDATLHGNNGTVSSLTNKKTLSPTSAAAATAAVDSSGGDLDGSTPSATLYICNLDRRITHAELWRTLSSYGRVLSVYAKQTFAYVYFKEVQSAVAARNELLGKTLGGKTKIVIRFKHPKQRAVANGAASPTAATATSAAATDTAVAAPASAAAAMAAANAATAPRSTSQWPLGSDAIAKAHKNAIYAETYDLSRDVVAGNTKIGGGASRTQAAWQTGGGTGAGDAAAAVSRDLEGSRFSSIFKNSPALRTGVAAFDRGKDDDDVSFFLPRDVAGSGGVYGIGGLASLSAGTDASESSTLSSTAPSSQSSSLTPNAYGDAFSSSLMNAAAAGSRFESSFGSFGALDTSPTTAAFGGGGSGRFSPLHDSIGATAAASKSRASPRYATGDEGNRAGNFLRGACKVCDGECDGFQRQKGISASEGGPCGLCGCFSVKHVKLAELRDDNTWGYL